MLEAALASSARAIDRVKRRSESCSHLRGNYGGNLELSFVMVLIG